MRGAPRSRLALWSLFAAQLALIAAVPILAFEPEMGPARESLALAAASQLPALSQAKAVRLAEHVAGASASGPSQASVYADLDLPALATARPVWVVPFDGFRVPQPDGGEPAPLDLRIVVDGTSGEPVSVFSIPSAGLWPKLLGSSEGELARRLGEVASASNALQPPTAPLAEILTVAWQSGVSMISSKQVVARFVQLTTNLPAKLEGEKVVPNRPPGPGWIVSGLGLQTPWGAERYETQSHVLVDDANRTFILGFRSP